MTELEAKPFRLISQRSRSLTQIEQMVHRIINIIYRRLFYLSLVFIGLFHASPLKIKLSGVNLVPFFSNEETLDSLDGKVPFRFKMLHQLDKQN